MRNYRGKSLGSWVYGDLVSRKGSLPPYIHFYDSDGCEYMCDIEINTLGESTGEKDINGTTIYTGDIVKRTSGLLGDEYDGFTGVVKFLMAAFVIESLDRKDGTSLGDDVAELEVLGNIYDNPELLEGVV
ncbi:YopX family protein [Ruminiclostridium josui]|uniref:YopX family protein n=1 Tax=Ruminiclostridium josui TaxID=1499 RepID=UPI00046357E7|nr:YopX family protein [Ruminiclostridium josui]